ncbi:hypothetical protein Z052_01785 [Halorubrum sp. C191]|nr:hypothetical protein Z052_01785 [Halorubrum sp. C191]
MEEQGYTGLKVDKTGGGGYHHAHDAGDILVGEPTSDAFPADLCRLYAIEEKYNSSETDKYIDISVAKTEAFVAFAEAIGAMPVLSVRWSTRREWSPGADHFHIDARAIDLERDVKQFSISPDWVDDGTPDHIGAEFRPTEVFF